MTAVCLTSIDQTSAVARLVASELQLGDAILLTGTLAAGKTYFVKALALALGCDASVTSPTYTIAHCYDTDRGNLIHIDAYRLSGLPEFYDLGMEEFFPESITVVEWGEKVEKAFAAYLSIEFTIVNPEENHRKLTFSYLGDRWKTSMEKLESNLFDFGNDISE
jgi:tRNA threonylcarbamoyladenosine biosynthesis protein TsaE